MSYSVNCHKITESNHIEFFCNNRTFRFTSTLGCVMDLGERVLGKHPVPYF